MPKQLPPIYPFMTWAASRHMGRTHAYALLNAGKIKTFMLGHRRFVTTEADAEFLETMIRESQDEAQEQAQ